MTYVQFENGTLFCFDVFRSTEVEVPSLVTGRFYMQERIIRDVTTMIGGRSFSSDQELIAFFLPKLNRYDQFKQVGHRIFRNEYRRLSGLTQGRSARKSACAGR